jgi:hypothetical protein
MVLFKDTSLCAEAAQLELFKQASPAKRFAVMSSFSSALRRISLKNLEERLDPFEARIEWMRLHYGEEIAETPRNKLLNSNSKIVLGYREFDFINNRG